MASRVFTDSTKSIKEKYLYIDSKTKELEEYNTEKI